MIMEIISAHADEPPFDSFEIIDSEKEKGIFSYPLTSLCAKNARRSFLIKQTEDISTLL